MGMRLVSATVLVLSLSACTKPGAKTPATAAPLVSPIVAATVPRTVASTTSTIAVTTTKAPPRTTVVSAKSAVLAGYEAYVAARLAGSVGGIGAASYRLQSTTRTASSDVKVRGVRVGSNVSAVEECIDGVPRLVVVELVGEKWVVSHVLGPEASKGWCE